MAAWFTRKRDVTPTIDSLSFDTSAWKYHGEQQPNQRRLWETIERDAVLLHFFGIPPDLPPVRTMGELSAFYAEGLKASGAKVVECELDRLAGCPAIRLLIKVPQKPHGMMYQGVLTLPFRDFSFVVKIQCQETGTTGIRETILFEKRMRAGDTPQIGGPGPVFPDWNPDAPEHDLSFPTHPISRLRRLLGHVMSTATLDPSVRELPGFPLPGSAP
jgi:hypothetical protein